MTYRLLDSADPRWTGATLSLLRVVGAFLFIQHGTQKLFGVPHAATPGPSSPFSLLSQTGVAGVLEVFGGLLVLVGLFTRPVAFLLSGEMAVAYFQVHAPRALLPIVNRGELPVLFCFLFLYFAFAGAGPWSIDAWLRARRPPRPSS